MAEKDTSIMLIFGCFIAKRSHGPVVKGRTFLAGGSWNAGSNPGVASSSFFFLSSSFYLLAFYCLFSLMTQLDSRDFCENVFLVILSAKLLVVYVVDTAHSQSGASI